MYTKLTGNIPKFLKRTACVFMVVFTGCADLEEDPSEALLPPGSYETMEEMQIAVTGMYGRVAYSSDGNHGTRLTSFFAVGWAGDDMTTHRASNKQDFRDFDQRNVSNLNGRSRQTWAICYAAIRAANNLITNSTDLVVSNPDQEEEKNRYLGEAHFIRAIMYHHLTRVFGKVPLQLEIEPDYDIELSEIQAVYEQIESDLVRAESLLPLIYPGVDPGAPRPNSGTARAFLARLYLDWAGFPLKDASKYTMAAASAKQVIDNSAAHGFGLMADLNDLWTVEHRFNKESIFTIVYCQAGCGSNQGNRKTGKAGNPADLGGWSETFAEINFMEEFPEGPRKEATYILDPLVDDPFEGADQNGPRMNWTAFTDQQNPIFAKVTGKGDVSRGSSNNDRNDYLMRYAEVLLTYAEASGRAGDDNPEAWEALNKIRRRAMGFPADTPNNEADVLSGDLAELAYTERKWELAGEYLRWFDLTRMERVAEALDNEVRNGTTSLGTNSGNTENFGLPIKEHNQIIGSTGTDNYFAPIPLSEVELNPKLGN